MRRKPTGGGRGTNYRRHYREEARSEGATREAEAGSRGGGGRVRINGRVRETSTRRDARNTLALPYAAGAAISRDFSRDQLDRRERRRSWRTNTHDIRRGEERGNRGNHRGERITRARAGERKAGGSAGQMAEKEENKSTLRAPAAADKYAGSVMRSRPRSSTTGVRYIQARRSRAGLTRTNVRHLPPYGSLSRASRCVRVKVETVVLDVRRGGGGGGRAGGDD